MTRDGRRLAPCEYSHASGLAASIAPPRKRAGSPRPFRTAVAIRRTVGLSGMPLVPITGPCWAAGEARPKLLVQAILNLAAPAILSGCAQGQHSCGGEIS